MEQNQRQERHIDPHSLLEDLERNAEIQVKPLRVVQICSARNSTYGAVTSLLTLSHELRNLGLDVSFATFAGRGFASDVTAHGFRAQEFPFRIKIDPLGIARLARWLRKEQVDVLHAHLSSSALNGGLAARLARVPSVATVHGLSGKLSFITCDHLIGVSAEVRRHLAAQGLSEAKISVVHNGIPHLRQPQPSDRSQARQALGLDDRALVLGTTARLTPLKGIDLALQAVRHVADDFPEIKFVIFGDGEKRAEYEQLTRDLGLSANVIFAGYRSDVRDLLPALDLFVFPSMKEAMGISVIEAMAAGVPVVAHEIGGIPEIVPDGTGLLVAPGDPVSLARAILRVLRNGEMREAMGTAGFSFVNEEFSSHRMASRTVGVYRHVISHKR